MENLVKEILKADKRSICVGKNTEKIIKLMDVTTSLYSEIYKMIEEINGEHLVDDIFNERFAEGFSKVYEGFRKTIGESVYEAYSFMENHIDDKIII